MKTFISTLLLIQVTFIIKAQTANEAGSGNALSFDGNDVVDVGDIGDLNTAYSAEVWAKFNSTGSGYMVSYRTDNQPNTFNIAIALALSSGNVSFTVRDNALNAANVSAPVSTNTWYHVAAVRDGNELRLYLNGVLQGTNNSTSFGALIMNQCDLGGTYHDGANFHTTYLDGQIDEVRVWDRALTQTEIRQHMCKELSGSEMGLIGYWRMDEGADNTCTSGADVCDATGNGNHGTKL